MVRSATSRSVRIGAVLALAAAPLIAASLPAGPALAATTTEPASVGAYFAQAAAPTLPEQVPAAPPNVGTNTDGVAAGDLPVAKQAPGDKKTFVMFDLAEVEPGSTINSAVVTLPLAPEGDGSFQVSAAPEKVKACKAGDEGFGEEDARSFDQAPTDDCGAFEVVAEAAGATTYTLDITELAQSWLDEANDGLALLPAVTSPFQVVFQPFSKITLTVDATPEEAEGEESEPVSPPTPPDAGSAGDPGTVGGGSGTAVDAGLGGGDLGGGFDGTSTTPGLGTDTGFAAPPVLAGDPLVPGSSTGGAEGAPAPVAAAGGGAAVSTTPIAARRPVTVSSIGAGFWVAAVLGAGVLALLSLVLGDARPRTVPVGGGARPGGVAAALSARRPTPPGPGGGRHALRRA